MNRVVAAVIATGALAVGSAQAQGVRPPPAEWRGAGPTPCVGSDKGVFRCRPAQGSIAIRAGHLFDARAGPL
jgi:hypothetical protein